jgi:hypothetical protein
VYGDSELLYLWNLYEEVGPPLLSSGSWLQNGDVLCFLWGTNWIYICYIEESRPPLWSSGQSSWLQNADLLCFLWGTNCIYICYVEESRPPLWSSGQSSWLNNGDVLCFLWGTNWIYTCVCYVEESRPPLWSSGQSSWLQIQGSGFEALPDFWEVVGLERGPLSLASTIEELLERKSNSSGIENWDYVRRDLSHWRRDTPLSEKSWHYLHRQGGGRSVGIVRSRTQATELLLYEESPVLHVVLYCV